MDGKILKPYVATCGKESYLLLDDFMFHKQVQFQERHKECRTLPVMIPPHFTSVLQLCDVGINKPLKDRLKRLATTWRP